MKACRKGSGHVSRWQKKKFLGVRESEVSWYRDVPMDGDLIAADYALSRLGEDRKQNALASAEILRMIYQGYLDVRKDASGKIEITFADSKYGKGEMDSIGSDLWSMMLEASGDDRVLQDKEFSAWSRKNKKRLYSWTEKMTLMGKKRFRENGWMQPAGTKTTLEGQLQVQRLVGSASSSATSPSPASARPSRSTCGRITSSTAPCWASPTRWPSSSRTSIRCSSSRPSATTIPPSTVRSAP